MFIVLTGVLVFISMLFNGFFLSNVLFSVILWHHG